MKAYEKLSIAAAYLPDVARSLRVAGCKLQVAGCLRGWESTRNPGENMRGSRRLELRAPVCLLVALLVVSGCASKAKEKAREHAAFVAGREEVLTRLQQARDTNVTVMGPVRNPVVPWTEDLTLAKALVTAEYQSPRTPRQIIILRAGQAIPVDPNQLLSGED